MLDGCGIANGCADAEPAERAERTDGETLTRRYRTPLLFLAASVLFGTSFVGIKTGLETVPPVLFAALRADIGAAILLSYVAFKGDYWRPRSRSDYVAVAASGIFLVAVNGVFVFTGQQYTTSGAAAVVVSLSPVLAPLFALVLLSDERLSPIGALGVLLGLVGVTIVVQPDPGSFLGTSGFGQALVAVAATSIAFGSVLLRRIGPDMGTLPLTAWALALAALLIHLTSFGLGEPLPVDVTPVAIGAVLYVGVFATAGAFPAYFGLIERAGPLTANLTAYAVPIVATIAGALVLGEGISLATVAGFCVIFAGFALIERAPLLGELDRARRWVRARRRGERPERAD